MIRILIADDHAIVRQGMRSLIESQAGWSVCGEAGDGPTALELAERLSPDLAILDVAMPGMSGLVLVRRLREACPQLRMLLFSFIDDEETVVGGLTAGAHGYVPKSEDSEVVKQAISTILAGGAYVSALLQQDKDSPAALFTPRELEIVQLVAEGKGNKQIAHLLQVSTKTVEVHRASAMKRADLRSIADLVRFAIRHRLV